MVAATVRNTLVVGAFLAAAAPAQVWTELGDAPSFPDGPAQVTRGETLDTISGSTGAGDLRDAYCIRIVEPDDFLATTDPLIAPGADADFDTRLFLFRRDGAPVLANDDTFHDEFLRYSILTSEATDGSGFVLTQPGEYVLIVAGYPDDPEDPVSQDLFDIDSDYAAVHAPDPTAGRFDHWEEGAPATGSYDVILAGVSACQNNLDAVFATIGIPDLHNRVCLGDDLGDFYCRDVSAEAHQTREVVLGFVDGDPHLDAVFPNYRSDVEQRNRVCLGSGLGSFTCSDMSEDNDHTEGLALGFVDRDQHLDAVLVNRTMADRVCLGNGLGGFTCSDLDDGTFSSFGVALGFADSDLNLDAVITDDGTNQICLGDGLGDFSCTDINTDDSWTLDVALGYVDGDPHLDAVLANAGYSWERNNRVCLGDGQGGFVCSDVSDDAFNSNSVALGFVNADPYLDAIFANSSSFRNRICLGDGLGGFTCSDVGAFEGLSVDVELGLVDGDQNLDAVFANRLNEPNHLCLGDGLGGFVCSDMGADSRDTIAVALGEVDDRPAVLPLFCFSFDNLCDGMEIFSVLPNKTVVASWYNWDCAGAKSPMLGGYSGTNVSPRLSWLAADPGADLSTWSFNLNVDARTFDLFLHYPFNGGFLLDQIQDDQPFSVTPGPCLFGPEKKGLPSSTGISE